MDRMKNDYDPGDILMKMKTFRNLYEGNFKVFVSEENLKGMFIQECLKNVVLESFDPRTYE